MPMPSPRTICEKPAPLATAPSMTAWSKRSCRCFSAANSTGSGSPTRRSPSLKPLPLSEHKREDSVEATIDRIMQTYALLVNRSAATSEEARAKVTEYVSKLFEAGEKDPHRLTVCGLTYLRELDGSTDPAKPRFTGLKERSPCSAPQLAV